MREYIIRKCLEMVMRSGVCPETPLGLWPVIIKDAYSKGFLVMNNKLDSFVCCWRVPEWNQDVRINVPKKSEGTILYVDWAVSESKDKLSLLRLLKLYEGIDEIVYCRRNDDNDFRRTKLRRLQHVG